MWWDSAGINVSPATLTGDGGRIVATISTEESGTTASSPTLSISGPGLSQSKTASESSATSSGGQTIRIWEASFDIPANDTLSERTYTITATSSQVNGARTAEATVAPAEFEELKQTDAKLRALRSASFELKHLAGSTVIIPGVLINRAHGKFEALGDFAVTVEGEVPLTGSDLEIGMVSSDGATYMTDILTGEWKEVPRNSLLMNFSDFGACWRAFSRKSNLLRSWDRRLSTERRYIASAGRLCPKT